MRGETGEVDLGAFINAGSVARKRILDSLADRATREGRPTGGIYDDILPTEKVSTGLMRQYEGKTGTAGLQLQRDLDNGNRSLKDANIGRFNGRNLQVEPKRVNGKVDPKALELFQGVGAWIKDNGESIYGTQPNPLPSRPAWGDANLSKDGKSLYLHVMEWPKDGKLFVEGLPGKATSASFVSPKAADTKIAFAQEGPNLNLTLPGTAIDPHDTVVKVSLDSPFHPKTKP